jgi:ankyrin repeat protein
MDGGSIATAAEDPNPGLDANGGEAPSADYGQQELVHSLQPDAADTAAKTIGDGKSETSDGQSDALRAGHDTEAIEYPRPSHDSNGSEDPSGDNSQREPTWSPQSDPADTTAKSVNNSGPDKNTGQSDAVSTGQNTEAAEDPTPSHATIGENPPSDSGQQEPVTHIPRPDTSHDAAVESNNDGETLESVIQYDSLSTTENFMETESATHILSTPQNVNTGLVEKTDDVEDVLVIAKPQSQSSRNLPSESDAKLDTERILTPDDEPGLESSSKPGSESDSESESESESVSGSDAESEDESIKVRLTRMSSENMNPEQVEANEALGQAIVDNKPDIFIDQIRKGASIKSRFDDEEDDGDRDQSTLFLAARHHSPDIAVEILKKNSDRAFLVDNMTNTWTAAHIAAKNGSESVLRHIVEASKESGATLDVVNARNRDNSTPLYLAAREGYLESVNMLLDNGADWKTQSGSDGTPLHAAAYHGHKDIVTRLLDLTGAKDLIGIPDGDGWTVLHCAALAGLDVTSLLDLYNNNEILEATTNETKLTPLHLAAANGHKNTVISLLAAGSDILARTSNKETVIHMAAESGNFDTLKALANRVDRKTMLAEDNEKGTALYSAATTGRDFDSVCFLMGHEAFMPGRLEVGVSAKVNRRDVQELEKFLAEYINDNDIISEDAKPNLILHLIVQWAVFYGWLSIADTYLTKSGHLHGLTTKYGETLLHVAACNGQNGVVRLLLRRFQERNQKRKIIMKKVKNKEMGGIIALHFAAGNNHLGTMKLLLEGDLKDGISARSGKGETALYFAARGGHEDVVKYLLEEMEGDSLPKIIRERTKEMKSPLSHAAENGHKNVAKALLDELKRHNFNTDPVVAWNQLIDIAQTGLEDYVEEIITDKIKLPNILRKSAKEVFPDLKFTGLLWAVYYGHYEVVWWLLRRNGPAILTSPIFEDAMDMVHKLVEELTDTMGNNTVELSAEEKKAKKLWYGAIKDCLCSPPRVANKYDQYDKDGTPNVPQLAKKKEDICKEYRATIVDFYKKDGIVSFAPLSRSIYDIIYDKASSIDEIMAGAGMDLKEPKSANDVLRTGQLTREPTAEESVAGELASRETAGEPPAGEPSVEAPAAEASTLKPPAVEPSAKEPTATAQKAGTQLQAPVAKQDQKLKQKQEHDDGYKFRWIHVPANNVRITRVFMGLTTD